MKKKNRIGTVFIYLIFIVLCLAILYPFLCVLSVSLSSAEDIKLYCFRVLPKHLDFSAYSYLFRDSKMLWQAYGTTIFVSVVGTAIGCLVTSLYAYAISRTTFRWRGVLSLFVTFMRRSFLLRLRVPLLSFRTQTRSLTLAFHICRRTARSIRRSPVPERAIRAA